MTRWSDGTPGLVVLPGGRRVRGRGLRAGLVPHDELPDLGVYLTGRPYQDQRWTSFWIRWPDFRLPSDEVAAVSALREAYGRAADERVEIACRGGLGRTGTAIAILARLAGVPASEAVGWTRANFRQDAIETARQRRFVSAVRVSV